MQEAAGAFAHLRDVAALRVEQPRPVDISPECASMLERLCLAQAQECIFEKARADNKSSAILARYDCQIVHSDGDKSQQGWSLACTAASACYGSQSLSLPVLGTPS